MAGHFLQIPHHAKKTSAGNRLDILNGELFIDGKRKERVQREFFVVDSRLSDIEPVHTGDPVETLMVRQAYAKLVPRDREILCLVDMLGLTYAQASSVIDVPLGTVMSRVSRARRAMIERMGETNVRPMKTRKG